jgi:hypothetical protein
LRRPAVGKGTGARPGRIARCLGDTADGCASVFRAKGNPTMLARSWCAVCYRSQTVTDAPATGPNGGVGRP